MKKPFLLCSDDENKVRNKTCKIRWKLRNEKSDASFVQAMGVKGNAETQIYYFKVELQPTAKSSLETGTVWNSDLKKLIKKN